AVNPWTVKGAPHDLHGRVEVGEEVAHHNEGLARVGLAIEDVQDHRAEDLARGAVPDRLVFASSAGIRQHCDQTLDLADLCRSRAYFSQRVEADGMGASGVQEA